MSDTSSWISRESARRVLWDTRESNLVHMTRHTACESGRVIEELLARSGWTAESYLCAALFDDPDLLEVSEQGA